MKIISQESSCKRCHSEGKDSVCVKGGLCASWQECTSSRSAEGKHHVHMQTQPWRTPDVFVWWQGGAGREGRGNGEVQGQPDRTTKFSVKKTLMVKSKGTTNRFVPSRSGLVQAGSTWINFSKRWVTGGGGYSWWIAGVGVEGTQRKIPRK